MHFDVPKLVQSPGCDHGHDEESLNGRDIKIDILDELFGHQRGSEEVSDKIEHRGVTGTPRGVNGPHGPKVEKRKGLPGQAAFPLFP